MTDKFKQIIWLALVISALGNLYFIHESSVRQSELVGFIKGASKCIDVSEPAEPPLSKGRIA